MPPFVLLWVWICAYLNCAGWLLSLAHELTGPGYAVALGLGLVLALICQKQSATPLLPHVRWQPLRRRFRRFFPLAFLVLTGLMFLGGVIYAPSNYDGLTYRLPRMLNWLAEGRWHWIHTIFPRVNARSCGVEWVSTPLIALTKTDRLLFLINVASYLLLPGLVYSVFTRLGVCRRVAWHWMWLVPTGYCFLIQAGGIGNDLFGAPFALAALDFALRARISRAPRDFYAAVLAAALMTSAKTSDLPLLLPWGIAILPSWRLMLHRPVSVGLVCVMAFAASFLPTALINSHYAHDWTGWKSEGIPVKNNPPLRLAGNIPLVILQNLSPPVFPQAGAWNRAVQTHMPASLSLRLHQTVVEPEAAEMKLEEMQIEENAGLGFGVSLLLILSVLAALRLRGLHFFPSLAGSPEIRWLAAVRWLPLVSLLALLAQSEVWPISRILAPYYALLMPAFLTSPAQAIIVARRWWRTAALMVFLLAALVLFISPARPLFPVRSILSTLQHRHPESATLARAATVYQVYGERNRAFAPILARLPANLPVLGLFTYDDPETSLWQPFGSRRVVHVCPGDSADFLRSEGIRYVVIPPQKLRLWFNQEPADWVRGLGAQVTDTFALKLRVGEPAEAWWLVKLP